LNAENSKFDGMRTWITALIVFILVFVFVYWLIPGKITIHQRLSVAANAKAFAREIADEEKWKQWWPAKQTDKKQFHTGFEYNGNIYSFAEKKLSSLTIIISKGRDSVLTELIFIPLQKDSIEVNWSGVEKTRASPFNRIQNFSWAKNISADLHFLLQKIRSFYSNEDNLYSFHIKKDFVVDSNLVSTSSNQKTYPTTDLIYKMIDRLKIYIENNGAKQTNAPMLNITEHADGACLTKLALPVDRRLKDSGDIKYRWMLGGGNILVTEVKGGPYQIKRAFNEMENYVSDHERVAPAIPFQLLITDRRQQPDTNKWVTKVYWPVM